MIVLRDDWGQSMFVTKRDNWMQKYVKFTAIFKLYFKRKMHKTVEFNVGFHL